MKIITHPDNIPLLKRTFDAKTIRGAQFVSMAGVEIGINGSRHIDRFRWLPPAEGRFEAYGPEDEVWMRPLGLGILEPVYYLLDDSTLNFNYMP